MAKKLRGNEKQRSETLPKRFSANTQELKGRDYKTKAKIVYHHQRHDLDVLHPHPAQCNHTDIILELLVRQGAPALRLAVHRLYLQCLRVRGGRLLIHNRLRYCSMALQSHR